MERDVYNKYSFNVYIVNILLKEEYHFLILYYNNNISQIAFYDLYKQIKDKWHLFAYTEEHIKYNCHQLKI